MSLSPKNEQQTTYGSYNVYGNDMKLDPAPAQQAAPAPKLDVAKERNELMKLYYERDKEFEAAKGKRTLLTTLLFVVAYFLIFLMIGKPEDLVTAAALLLPSLFLGILHFWANLTIFGYLCRKGREETEILERIRKRILDLDKQ